jgi:hypothetical protein
MRKSVMLPSKPPAASLPSFKTARDMTELLDEMISGSPVPFLGQILISPSWPAVASRPSSRTAFDLSLARSRSSARDHYLVPGKRFTGSPFPSVGQTLITL